jgi:hypothetical protein
VRRRTSSTRSSYSTIRRTRRSTARVSSTRSAIG